METVNSLYQLPPAQASLTHRLVTCLEWAAGEHTHESAQRATGHSSFPVNCVQVRPCSQTRSLFLCYFFVKTVSFHFENVLWALGFNSFICFPSSPSLQLWRKHSLIKFFQLGMEPLTPKNLSQNQLQGGSGSRIKAGAWSTAENGESER